MWPLQTATRWRQKESGVYELAGRDYTVRAGYENGQLVLLEMSRNYTVNG